MHLWTVVTYVHFILFSISANYLQTTIHILTLFCCKFKRVACIIYDQKAISGSDFIDVEVWQYKYSCYLLIF